MQLLKLCIITDLQNRWVQNRPGFIINWFLRANFREYAFYRFKINDIFLVLETKLLQSDILRRGRNGSMCKYILKRFSISNYNKVQVFTLITCKRKCRWFLITSKYETYICERGLVPCSAKHCVLFLFFDDIYLSAISVLLTIRKGSYLFWVFYIIAFRLCDCWSHRPKLNMHLEHY